MEATPLNCALCSLLGSADENGICFSTMNDTKVHARIHFAQVKVIEDGEIDEQQIYDRCFPKSLQSMRQVHQTLANICRSLFGKRPKVPRIECNLCGNSIDVERKGKPSIRTRCTGIIAHACVHAQIKPFKCHCCENSFRSRADIGRHFRRAHGGTKLTKNDFEDQSETFHGEISNSINRCFAKRKNEATSKEAKEKIRDEISVRHHLVNGTDIAVQRQIVCSRTLKKSVESDGTVKCRICSTKITAKKRAGSGRDTFRNDRVIDHALFHLRKPLYRCRVCNADLITYNAMLCHLKRKHKLGMEKNHECFADKYHSDILAIFAQCFEKD